LAGLVLASVVALSLIKTGIGLKTEHIQLISYPLTFLPAMIYARAVSYRNMYFEDGYAVDSKNFGSMKTPVAFVLGLLSAVALSFALDFPLRLLPEIPDKWRVAMEALTQGNFFICFTCVCIFAPFFEEWLLRGIILRGLLNCKRSGGRRGFHPAVSIIVSALLFAVVHFNIWQGLPAFAMGCLFGYVYYKTGSLKLTMLMHFANNFMALVAGQIIGSDADNWYQIIPAPMYYALTAACVAVVLLTVLRFRKIETPPQGGCWLIPTSEPQA
jgi:membrane protease YdiL (CAAX protease family)